MLIVREHKPQLVFAGWKIQNRFGLTFSKVFVVLM